LAFKRAFARTISFRMMAVRASLARFPALVSWLYFERRVPRANGAGRGDIHREGLSPRSRCARRARSCYEGCRRFRWGSGRTRQFSLSSNRWRVGARNESGVACVDRATWWDSSAPGEFSQSAGDSLAPPETANSSRPRPALDGSSQASRTVGNWNATKSFWASGCMNIVSAAIPSWFSARSWMECAFQRLSAPRE